MIFILSGIGIVLFWIVMMGDFIWKHRHPVKVVVTGEGSRQEERRKERTQ